MIVAVCLELDGNNGSATQSRSRRRTSQAGAGPIIIRRAAGPNKAANATRAIIRRFLADRPRGEKARAAGAIGGDAGLAGRAWGTQPGDVALSSARGRLSGAAKVELFRARREQGNALSVKDPEPPESLEDVWTSAAQIATVGIFVLLLVVCLFFSRALLLPVAAALVIGTTLAPIVKAAARHRISPWVTALALGAV